MASTKRGSTGSAGQKPAKKIRVGAVRIKEDPDRIATTAVAASENNKATKASVKERFISLLSEPKNKSGVSNKAIQEKFHDSDQQRFLVEVINELARESRLHMSKSGVDNQLFYTLVADEVAQKYQGLDVSAKMVLQVIEKAGNNGIWTKDIRMQTNIQQQALNKIFKQLEQRRLIKPVKSVAAKAKKLYMLYELTPSKELTGGVWYSGLEFDHEFISELRTFVMHCVRRLNGGQGVTLSEIKGKMVQANVSRVELSLDEVKQLVQTLVYDYYIEEGLINDNGEVSFLAARRVSTMCEFKWWDALSPDFHFRAIKFEDGVTLGPHELHHHTA
jgi:DNA-directed RNA polymerase III subunit RPC6